jgi:hypothetical protein
MEEIGGQNSNQTPASYVPPPTTEVSVRTMETDLRSVAASGGGLASGQKIAVPLRNEEGENFKVENPDSSGHALRNVLIVVLILIVLGGGGWFLYPKFFNQESPVQNTTTTTPGLPDVSDDLNLNKFEHVSLLGDQNHTRFELMLVEQLPQAMSWSAVRGEIQKKLEDKVLNIKNGFFEVDLIKTNAEPLALANFLDFFGTPILAKDFSIKNLNQDFTFFGYKEKNNWWPGMVISFSEGKSWIGLKAEIMKLEQSGGIFEFSGITNNLKPVFKDDLFVSQPIRTFSVSTSSISRVGFFYGWFHDSLVLSASEEGFREAIRKL